MKSGQVKRRMMKKVGDIVGRMLARKEEQKVKEPIEVITKSKFSQLLEFYTKGMKKEENVKEKEMQSKIQKDNNCNEENNNSKNDDDDDEEFDLELEKENKSDDNDNNNGDNDYNNDDKTK